MRILGLLKTDPATEANAPPPSKELMERMGVFIEEMTNAGVMLATNGLHPSASGKRVKLANGKISVIDGPFTESKELIASYAIFEVKTMDEAIMWTTRFLQVLGQGECELRPIFDPADFSPEVFSPAQAAREDELRQQMGRNAGKR